MHHPTDRIVHTTTFVTPVVEHWLEREIAQWVHHEGKPAAATIWTTNHFFHTVVPIKICNLKLVSASLSYPIFEKDNFIK